MTGSTGLRAAVDRREAAAPAAVRSFDPWSADALVRVVAANIAALILVGLAWYQSSGESVIRTQLSWLELSVAGAVLAGVVNANWLLRGRRTVVAASAAALEPLQELDLDLPRGAAAATTAAAAGKAEPVLWVPGTERFHRADCKLVAGKDVRVVTASQRSQLHGCEVCRAR